MKLSFITDEVTQNFEQILAFANEKKLQGIELRTVENMPIDRIPIGKLKEFKAKLADCAIKVCNLSGSFYKCEIDDEKTLKYELEKLKRLCEAAHILDCRTIRGFAFFKKGSDMENMNHISALFEQPCKILEGEDRILLLESDPSVCTYNHKRLAELLKYIHHPNIGAIYDPGNDIYDEIDRETPYPDGYEAIKSYLTHIHIKDAVLDSKGKASCVKIGTGLVNYPALLARLYVDRYDGWFSMETHYRKSAALTEEQMRLPGGQEFSEGGWEATAECIDAFRTLSEEAGYETAN